MPERAMIANPITLLAAKCGAALLIIVAAFGLGHHQGAKTVQGEWDAAKVKTLTTTQAAILAAVAANEAAHQIDIDQSTKTIATYERTIQAANDTITAERAAAGRLRINLPGRNCAAAAGQASSPVLADGARAPESIELPEQVDRGLRDLAESADRQVTKLQAKVTGLQDWASSHGFAPPMDKP